MINGSVTKDGVFKFTVAVADSGGQQASKSVSIQVFKALKVTPKCANTCVVGKGCAKCGSFGSVTGGQTPYAYKVTGGAVPSGMKLSALSLAGGFPTAGNVGLTVQVTDKLGANASVSAKWSVYAPATLVSGGDCISNQPNPSCSVRWTYSGGNPTVAPKLTVGFAQYCNANGTCQTPTAPPPGWAVTVKSGVVTISASSTACVTSYLGTLKLALVDPSACATTSPSNTVNLIVDLEFAC